MELLKTLPHFGEVKAQTIMSCREANAGFSSVENLIDVPGIGPVTREEIRDLVEAR